MDRTRFNELTDGDKLTMLFDALIASQRMLRELAGRLHRLDEQVADLEAGQAKPNFATHISHKPHI
ncbi:MAG: hypothetical protein ABSD74_18925 [Rhizomicrobium sp.]|jgi:polyhydroxyalkanoate synthesis regulator phasin